jgi:tRNA (guanine37-N1)-methyltransferase
MASSLRPPINRAMRTLDRSFFNLTVPISAARVFQNQYLSKLRSQLLKTNDLIEIERLSPIARDPEPELAAAGKKCLLLRSDLKHNGREYL